jgi:Uma2 family endonuclease
MSNVVNEKMVADEFLLWAEAHEGRWELHDGAVRVMPPETIDRAQAKSAVVLSLEAAVAHANARCKVFSGKAAVRVNANTVFEPDALVCCGTRTPCGVEARNPIIVVDILGSRLVDYFSLPDVAHYLNLDPDRRVLIHHKRGQGDIIETRILTEGLLRLDPPGLEAPVAEMFAAE